MAARGASNNQTAGMTSRSQTAQHRGTTISAVPASNRRMPARARPSRDDEVSTKICYTVSEVDSQESRLHQPLSGEHQCLSQKRQRQQR